MRVDVLTKEYPPEIYGGAGVHVAELVRALRARDDLDTRVHAFGARARRGGHHVVRRPRRARLRQRAPSGRSASTWRSRDGCAGADLVHSHTWYANLGGHLAGLLHGVPHVVTAHSLEPMRPWKAEQLGGGYAVSSWVERTAYEAAAAVIAVSAAMRDRRAALLPRRRPGPGARGAQRHRHRALVTGRRPRPGAGAGRGPGPPVGRVRRPDHPAEGAAAVPARRRPAAAGRAARAVRRRAGHPRDRGRGDRARRTGSASRATASSGSGRCSPAPTSSRC